VYPEMALKFLDIQYLRAQNTSVGQVLLTTPTTGVTTNANLVVVNGNVGINTTLPTEPLSVTGNIKINGASSELIFPDGSRQSTAGYNTYPGGSPGSIQYDNNGTFAGDGLFLWDTNKQRLGIGTNQPRSTFQIIDVGYESTNTSTSDTNVVVLDEFPVPDYRSCHYIVQITDLNNSWFHTSQIMLIHDGLGAYKSEYNIVTTQEKLGEFDCRILAGNVQLTFSAFYTSDKNIKVIRTSIEP
jgi:hypothetical protein